MKTLQVSNCDTIGSRFNGGQLHEELLKRGIDSQFCVWDKKTDGAGIWRLSDFPGSRVLRYIIGRIERLSSLQSILYPFSLQFLIDKRFRCVDLAHYHLIHTGFFSLITLPVLSRMRPTIWTLHDPWAMTGHCIYPFECERWKSGCERCVRLDAPMHMRGNRTGLMWKIKRWVYHHSDIDIIVASKWMHDMARKSPLLSKSRIHYTPLGIDLELFRPTDANAAKQSLGIKPGSIVLGLRATNNEFKGLTYIKECLRKLKYNKSVCLLTVEEKGLLDEFKGKYPIVDLGQVDDERLVSFYNACDIFLMPSTAEAFGMMAIEAMACGKPVIVFDGTALPEVIFGDKGGIVVPHGDANALGRAIEKLIDSPRTRQKIGKSALEVVRKNYDLDIFMGRLIRVYRKVIERYV